MIRNIHSAIPTDTTRPVPPRVQQYAPKGSKPVAIVDFCYGIRTGTAYYFAVPERFGKRHDVIVDAARVSFTLSPDPIAEDGAVADDACLVLSRLVS